MQDGMYLFFIYLSLLIIIFLYRFKVDMAAYPIMTAIEERLSENPAFKDAHPNNQPDYPGEDK
jgi:hypothetical protein